MYNLRSLIAECIQDNPNKGDDDLEYLDDIADAILACVKWGLEANDNRDIEMVKACLAMIGGQLK